MRLLENEEERDFREEIREIFRKILPAEIADRRQRGQDPLPDEERELQAALDAHQLGAPSWPVAFGGRDWSPAQQHIFDIEYGLADMPDVCVMGVSLAGPIICEYGTSEQKAFFLPAIRSGKLLFCQGFSEPDAGSDLASLKTFAKRTASGYIVNGSKIWTSLAHYSDYIFCLVRTSREGKPQSGLSMLLIPMNTPGITVTPIETIDAHHHVNQVFLDNVEVPFSSLLGEENKGWTYAKFLLDHEKTFNARIGRLARIKERMIEAVAVTPSPNLRLRVARLVAQIEAFEITVLRARQADGSDPDDMIQVAALKITGSELMNEAFHLMLELAPPLSDGRRDPAWRQQDVYWRASTIFGGTNDIQRGVVWRSIASR
jgi:alkylation response protein AidB-like acyl-CoA dehydrogenase